MRPEAILLIVITAVLFVAAANGRAAEPPRPRVAPGALRAVPFTQVRLREGFWADRVETALDTTIPARFRQCEETGRLTNFARVAGFADGGFEGYYFNDSDVYKVIEGASYALAVRPDARLDRHIDKVIAAIAAAQQPDGYLNTYFTLAEPDQRWADIRNKHELYCAGHLFEAAAAHFRATGKRTLLDVATRFADYIDTVFGPGPRSDPPGHEEIEIGLVKLHDVTGEARYLRLAEFFLDQRGRADGRESYGVYAQDHAPVTEQVMPAGHAVRAMYLYCGMADVAARTGRDDYLLALARLWDDLVRTKLYVTGGIGARGHGEAFGEAYELPNESAYAETCAAIGLAFLGHRLGLARGDATCIDVLERALYNGLLSGVSLDGERFFYPNPLASHGGYHRSSWFACACCPVNIARFIPSIGGALYAQTDDAIALNLYAASEADLTLPGGTVTLAQRTDYPWDGRVTIEVSTPRELAFDLLLRIPGWARGEPLPSDLYTFADAEDAGPGYRLTLNGTPVDPGPLEHGYARLRRTWRAGDTVTLDLDMPVRLLRAHDRVEADRGRAALQRGPIVYCVEAIDVDGNVRHLWLDQDATLRPAVRPDLLGGVTVIEGVARARRRPAPGEPAQRLDVPFTAIPYFAWDHRAAGEMAVWIPTDEALAEVIPAPTLASRSRASASHCFEHDTVTAVNDLVEPAGSIDHDIPRLTWWDHRGTTEWVQYDFPSRQTIRSVEVYWFDDIGIGQCRIPTSWRLLHRDDRGAWQPVEARGPYGLERDGWNRVEFAPVETDGLRLKTRLRDGFSGGILEWRVE